MHNFQLNLLWFKNSRANEARKMYKEIIVRARSVEQKRIDEQSWASVFRFVRCQFDDTQRQH